MKPTVLIAAALAVSSGAAFAQPRENWDPGELYRHGLSARQLLDAPVRADNGKRVGDVKDIIVDRGGNIRKLVVEAGGLFEVGDQHIGVLWRDVSIGEDMEFVQVPLRELESGTYSLFGETPQGEDVPAALTSWRVNELVGDYARLADVPRYGLVTDVIFSNRGEAKAVIVERARSWGGHGLYAFPFEAFDRAAAEYTLPYRREVLVLLKPFNYGRLDRQSLYAGK